MGSRSKKKQLIRAEMPGWSKEEIRFQNLMAEKKDIMDREMDAARAEIGLFTAARLAGGGLAAAGDGFPAGGGFVGDRERRDATFRHGVERRRQAIALIEQSAALKQIVEEAREDGRRFGYKEAALQMFKTCIAAACVALHDELDLTEDQIFQTVTAVGEKIIFCLNNQDLVDETLDKTGIEIRMDDALEPIQQK